MCATGTRTKQTLSQTDDQQNQLHRPLVVRAPTSKCHEPAENCLGPSRKRDQTQSRLSLPRVSYLSNTYAPLSGSARAAIAYTTVQPGLELGDASGSEGLDPFASCTTWRLEFICSPVLPTRRSPIRVEYERRLRVRQFFVGWSRGLSGRVRLGRDVCSRRRRAAEGADRRVSSIDNTFGISMIPSSNWRSSHNGERTGS